MNVASNWRAARRFAAGAACVSSAILLLSAPALSQRAGDRERVIRERNADMMREIEIRRREGAVKTVPQEGPANPVIPYAEAKEDFRRLQLVNNEMMAALFPKGATAPLDCRLVSEAAAEINKRAARLKSNLRLPEPERDGARRPQSVSVSDEGQLRDALIALDELIMRFVTHPVFKTPVTVDARQSAEVRQHLVRIIELSKAVRAGAQKLGRTRDAKSGDD
jgi:hypothetical protein